MKNYFSIGLGVFSLLTVLTLPSAFSGGGGMVGNGKTADTDANIAAPKVNQSLKSNLPKATPTATPTPAPKAK